MNKNDEVLSDEEAANALACCLICPDCEECEARQWVIACDIDGKTCDRFLQKVGGINGWQ